MKNLHPILNCEESLHYEHELLEHDVEKTWRAMNRAGRSLGSAALNDFREVAEFPQNGSILVLAGKGHNAGDAILAADQILRAYPLAEVTIVFVFGEAILRPLVTRAYSEIVEVGKVTICDVDDFDTLVNKSFDMCIDGLLGMQFSPPFRDPLQSVVCKVNSMEGIRFRVAVDLPTGVGEDSVEEPFRADFTYATGIAKTPLFKSENAPYVGRIRYLNIGFFDHDHGRESSSSLLLSSVLEPLQKLRHNQTDKRDYGHLYILSGSRNMPGALLMSVKAALHSGAGLVTVFAPESVASTFATEVPEAMWVPWPETPDGGLALEGKYLLQERISRADALLMGPGMGREHETQKLVLDIIGKIDVPIILDADALFRSAIDRLKDRPSSAGDVLITPHLGEFGRINSVAGGACDEATLKDFCRSSNLYMLLKGPITRVCSESSVCLSTFGGPILARGGSGDILSGLIGGMIAGSVERPFEVLCKVAVLQGIAADLMAREHGHVAVSATDILPYLSKAIRSVVV